MTYVTEHRQRNRPKDGTSRIQVKRLTTLFIFLAQLLVLAAQDGANSTDFITRIRGEIDVCRKDASSIRQATEDAWETHSKRMKELEKESDDLLNQLEQLKDDIDELKSENAVAARQNAVALNKKRLLEALLPADSKTSRLHERATVFLAEKQSELEAILQPPSRFGVTFKTPSGRVSNGEAISYGPMSLCFSYLDKGQLFFKKDGNELPEFHCQQSGYEKNIIFPVDITGKHPELLTESSGLLKHLKQGGIMMIPILLLGISCVFIVVLKIAELFLHRPSMDLQALEDAAKHTDSIGEALEDELFALAQQCIARHGRFIFWLSVSASAAPLLGLLGTVTGMIHTFRLITFFGVGDARLLADGISEALVTTEAGLCIAIPALLCHAWLNRRLRRISTELEGKIASLCDGAVVKPEQPPQEQP